MLIKKDKLIGNKGQTLVEALVAIGVFLVSINAIIFLLFAAQSIFVDTERNQEALNYASDGIEAAKSIRNRNWDELTDGEHGLLFSNNQWTFSGTSDSKNNLTRKIVITTQNDDIKDVKSVISWQTNPLNPRTLQTEETLTRWEAVLNSGGGDGTTGNWSNPITLTSMDTGPGTAGTDVAVTSTRAYLSSSASNASKPDLSIFDISNPINPTLITQKDFGIYGINNIAISENYLYAVTSENDQEFLVIDISNPASPSLVATLDLPGDADTISIFDYNNFVYVGRETEAPQELVVIDVSNPLNPQYYSGLSEVGDQVNDIFIYNDRAYVEKKDDSKGIILIDVSNPAALNVIGTLNTGGSMYGIFVQNESRVFAGSGTKFYAINAVDLNNIFVRDTITTYGTVNDIFSVGNLSFLATSNSNKEFQVINIADPSNLILISYFNFPQVATGIDYINNLIFVSVRSNDALRIITSTQ